MGNHLDRIPEAERVLKIDSVSFDAFSDGGFCAGGTGMIGRRDEFEDEHVICQLGDLEERHYFLAVFDGHGGAQVAKRCLELSDTLQLQEDWKEYVRGGCCDLNLMQTALGNAFVEHDKKLLDSFWLASTGSTAVVCIINRNYIVCANAGDSRAVLGQVDGSVVELSIDHKPNRPTERGRIEAAGGVVTSDEYGNDIYYRIDNGISVSRGFGDKKYKDNPDLSAADQLVSCVPEIIIHTRDDTKDDLLLLACDGLWDVCSSQEALEHARQCLVKYGEQSLLLVAEEMCDFAFEKRSTDNISCIAVRLPGAQRHEVNEFGGGVDKMRLERAERNPPEPLPRRDINIITEFDPNSLFGDLEVGGEEEGKEEGKEEKEEGEEEGGEGGEEAGEGREKEDGKEKCKKDEMGESCSGGLAIGASVRINDPEIGASTLYIIRHSERLDEVEDGVGRRQWDRLVRETYMGNDVNGDGNIPFFVRCRFQDCKITTPRGVRLAENMAIRMRKILDGKPKPRFIFSSRLRRAVETAVPLALALDVPVLVSRGLSEVAAAVSQFGPLRFEYLSMRELREICPSGVTLQCCDEDFDIDGEPLETSVEKKVAAHTTPYNDWRGAVEAIARKGDALIVAHRETFRNITGQGLSIPYCCIGQFIVRHPKDSSSSLSFTYIGDQSND